VDRHILAVDLGTSALKAALVSVAGEVVAAEQEPCTVTLLSGGGAEQDPRQWWKLITRASARLMARGTVPADSVVAVACTAQWSGTVPVDERGEPIRDAIIWMDSRGAPYVRRITGGAVRVQGYGVDKLARWLRTTGGIPAHSGKDPIAHILWLKHEEPETYRRARLFLEPKDWLNAHLTGRPAASFDSIALHWVTDNRRPGRIRYHPALLQLARIEPSKLPELLAATDILGPLSPGPAAELGVPAGIPVVAGTPVRGGFHNLSLSASRDDLVRAVFEGVALNTRWLLEAVERFTRHRMEPIRFIGGGARSDVWCQIFADVLGGTIEQVADPVNANARGAGLLAAVALGELTFDQVPDRVQVARSYRPDPAANAVYEKLFGEFTALYRRNRKAHTRLNRDRERA
jgi:sugar (pentulose or hexulose) kinase